MSGSLLGALEIGVEFGPPLAHLTQAQFTDRQTFATELLRRMNELLTDLTIPAKVSVSVKHHEAGLQSGGNPFRVFVAGKQCRLPLVTLSDKDKRPLRLARFIADGIQQNLELLIEPTLSKEICKKWVAEKVPSPVCQKSDEFFLEVLSLLVARGFKIERLKKAKGDDHGGPGALSTEEFFEQAVAGLDTTNVRVFLKDENARTRLGGGSLEEGFASMQDRLFEDLGLMVPQVVIDLDDQLDENEFRFQLNDVRFSPVTCLAGNQYLVDATRDKLKLLGIDCSDTINPETGFRASLILGTNEDAKKCQDAGYKVSARADFIFLTLAGAIRKNAGNLLTAEIVRHCAGLMQERYPALVVSAFQRFDLTQLAKVLRTLLDEEISIRNLRTILESLLAIRGITDVDHNKYFVFHPDFPDLCPVAGKTIAELGSEDYSSCLRMALKRHISYRHAKPGETLIVYLMSPTIEAAIANSEKKPLSDTERTGLVKAIFDRIGNRSPGSQAPVILTTVAIRRRLRNLIEKEFPRLAVLCNQELSDDLNIQSIAQISWD